jgi:uncharacterized delta-60 repeat protein
MRTSFVGVAASSGGGPGAPGATRNVVATASSEGADVAWDTPISNGGSAITDYELQSILNVTDGALDTVFETNTGTGFNGDVKSIAIQSDGKIVCGGNFSTFNGTTVNRIARLNSDGTLDTAFATNIGTGSPMLIVSVAIQSDGKIVCGGNLTSFNGTTVNYIVRLNSDGTRDTTFTTNTGTAFNDTVSSIAIQSDGKIICGGSFTSFNGTTVNRIVRLNSDGTRDIAFTTNTGTAFNGSVQTVSIQSDGKIVCGGFFSSFNSTGSNSIARLNSDGTLDTAFATNIGGVFNNLVYSIAFQSDGKIVVGGWFDSILAKRIARLNTDGTRDTTFATNVGTSFNSNVTSIAIQSNDKIVCVGDFTSFNGTTTNYVTRLNANGTLDTTFAENAGAEANDSVNSLAIQSDGRIVFGGLFTAFASVLNVNRIARINGTSLWSTAVSTAATAGALDTEFDTNTGTGFDGNVDSIAIQSDGKIICGGSFTSFNGTTVNSIVRLNSDDTRDTTFTTNVGTGFDYTVQVIAIQSDGKIVCGGGFNTFNGATVNSIVRLNSDGTRDTTFTTNTGTGFSGQFGDEVFSLAIQSDGKILCGGQFISFNGTTVNYIVRLNSDGTRDTTFTTNTGTGFNNSVKSLAIQSDGKILCGGQFISFNGTTVNSIVRLNSDGTRDTTFTTNTGTGFSGGLGASVNSIAIQSDGKIVCGGSFTSFNGTTANDIVRLNPNGTLDITFITNIGTGVNGIVSTIAIQSDGKIVCGGFFSAFNGVTIYNIVRLNADGTRNTTFTTNTGTGFSASVNSIVVQSDGKIVCGGSFTIFNPTTTDGKIFSNGTTVNCIARLKSGLESIYTFAGLIGGTGYLFRARAVNAIGNGPYSQTTSAIAAIAPIAPSVAITSCFKEAIITGGGGSQYFVYALGTLNPNGASTTVVLEYRVFGAPTWSTGTVFSSGYDPLGGPFTGTLQLEIAGSSGDIGGSSYSADNYEARFVATNAYGTSTSSILNTGI